MKSTKFGFMKITTHAKASQVLTPILIAIAAIGLISGLNGCGSGAVGAPPDTTPIPSTPLAVSPPSADLFPDVPTTFTITGGKPGYSAFSSNNVVLPVTATLPGTTFTVIPGPVTAETAVDITVKDAANASASAKATVKPSTLINQITFTPSAPTATGCGAALCSGNDAQVVVKAALNGVVLRSRQIRFDAFQGDFKIALPGAINSVSSITVLTDEQGEATVRLVANAGVPTQVATLQISDVTSGQNRKYSFNIIQQISGVGVLSTLPSESVVIKGAPGVSGTADGTGKCPTAAQVDYLIFGGTAPYSVTSSRPDIASVAPSSVSASGGRFSVNVRDCGQAVFVITDATGRTIQTPMLDSQRGDSLTVITIATPPLAVSPPTSIGCNSSASAAISGSGNFVAAINTAIPNDQIPNFKMTPSFGTLPNSITFSRSNSGNVPAQILVTITDGKTSIQLTVTTTATCPPP
jgi:hypothetical protein